MEWSKDMKLLVDYSKRVFGRWKYAYGLITFGLTATAILTSTGVRVLLPAWAWVVVLFLSLYFGTFLVYKEIAEKLPKAANLTIECRKATFGARAWSGAMPKPGVFAITLDLINRGKEQATLTDLQVTRFDMNTSLLEDEPQSTKLHRPGALASISLPWIIPPEYREPDLKFDIDVKPRAQTTQRFAQRLMELQDYEIELQYSYEDMARSKHYQSILISGSFGVFKERVLQNWRKDRPELFAEAVDVRKLNLL